MSPFDRPVFIFPRQTSLFMSRSVPSRFSLTEINKPCKYTPTRGEQKPIAVHRPVPSRKIERTVPSRGEQMPGKYDTLFPSRTAEEKHFYLPSSRRVVKPKALFFTVPSRHEVVHPLSGPVTAVKICPVESYSRVPSRNCRPAVPSCLAASVFYVVVFPSRLQIFSLDKSNCLVPSCHDSQ